MKQNDIMVLNNAGNIMLTRALEATESKIVLSLSETGMACLREARVIFNDLAAKSSVLAFISCLDMFKEGNSYPAYLEFCARNGCKMESEAEFNLQMSRLPR